VYSTCTLHPAENGEVAARFLREHPEFEPEPIDFAHAVDEPAYMLTMLPGKLDTDGFFAARFRRKKEIV
jgi:16S rRNA (cytosine967-C5)-methyltransferase